MDVKKTAETLLGLECACFSEPWTFSALEYQSGNENTVISFGYDGGKAVGYALGTVICGEGELYRIGVLPEYRGRGLGKRILSEFLCSCQDKEAEKIFLEVRSKNSPAIALYQHAGFVQLAVRKGYYGDDDALIFELNL